MNQLRNKRLLCVFAIVITLLCTAIVKADFYPPNPDGYTNSVSEPSYEPVDFNPVDAAASFRAVPPSATDCHNHKISAHRQKIPLCRDAVITIENTIKNSDSDQILSVSAENINLILYDVIICLGRYIS